MYMRSQTWIENGPAPIPCASRWRRRGMGSTASEAWCELVGCSLPPGSPCYDTSFMPGMTHGANPIQSLFNSNATMSTSAAERACLAGDAPTPQPLTTQIIGPPIGLETDPTGSQGTLTPAPAVTVVNTGCPDGTTNCLAAGGGAGCPWWCGIPGSSTFDVNCLTCPNTGIGQAALIGLLGLAAFALFGLLKK